MQRIKVILWFVAGLMSAYIGLAQGHSGLGSSTQLTLKACLDIALKNNLQIEQNQLTMQANGIYRNQAISNLLPTINASGSQGTNYGKSINPTTYAYINQQQNTGNYGLNAGLLLFSGFQLQNALKQSGLAYDASKLDWQQQKDNITLNVLLAYLQVLSSKDLLEIAIQQAEVDKKNVERLQLLNNDGAIAPATLSDLKGQYAGDLVNISGLSNAYESAKINLFQIMNIPYQREAVYEALPAENLDLSSGPGNPDSIYQVALNSLPIVKSTDLRVKSYQKALLVSRGQYFPSLSLYGALSSNYSNLATSTTLGPITTVASSDFVTIGGSKYNVFTQQQNSTSSAESFGDQFRNNQYTQVGLSLQVPILNYLRVRNNVKLAKINLQNQVYIAENTRLQVQQSVEAAFQNLVAAKSQYKSYGEQVEAYNESLRAAEVKFKAGVITSVDYVIAKNNADRANNNLIAAKYNFIFRTKILDYYKGILKL